MSQWCRRVSEAVLLAMACLSPWAFGSVLARFEFFLTVGVATLAVLGVITTWNTPRWRTFFCIPSIALAALVLLAVVQALPLPGPVLLAVAPETANLRAKLLPQSGLPERVLGDSGPAVSLSPQAIGQDRDATLHMAAQLASAWIVFQSVLNLGGGLASFRRFAIAITANATLLALFSLIQRLTWNGKIYWTYPAPFNDAGPFISHNHLGAYLNLGFGFALAVLISPRRKHFLQISVSARLLAGYAVGAVAVGIVASHSRSAFLSMIVALLLGVVLFRPRGIVLACFLGAALVLIPALLVTVGGTSSYEKRLATIFARASYAGRLGIWHDSLQAWRISPLFGTGLGNFSTATARFFRNDNGERYFHAENEYVEWLVEGGMTGFALVLAAVLGISWLTRRALSVRRDDADRALIWGAAFGSLTLLLHSSADFALRIPGVCVTATILCAYLCKSGLEVLDEPSAGVSHLKAPLPSRALAPGRVVAISLAIVSGVLLFNAGNRAASEWEVTEKTPFALTGGIPLTPDNKDFNWPEDFDWEEAQLYRGALDEALRYRPNWGEGHLRRGTLLVDFYKRWVLEGLARSEEVKGAPAKMGEIAHPSYLYKHVHAPEGLEPLSPTELVEMEPVRTFLVPAARSFLEARRCDLLLPLPHAELAVLDYLLEGGDHGRDYLNRALFLARSDRRVTEAVGQSAQLMRETSVTAAAWKQLLVLDPSRWDEIAESASELLTPNEILEKVVPDGRTAIQFAAKLYTLPWQSNTQREFLEAGIRRLTHDSNLGPAERLRWEAEANFLLGESAQAAEQMTRALVLEPDNLEWRKTLVRWLIGSNRLPEAHEVALAGVRVSNNSETQSLLAEVLAEQEKQGRDARPR